MRKAILLAVVLGLFGMALFSAQSRRPATAATAANGGRLLLPMLNFHYQTPVQTNETILWDIQRVNAPQAWAGTASPRGTGAGIVVAVLDTGADLDHPDLQANLLPGRSYHAATADDGIGHGTHVAGSVAAVAGNGGIVGVAPHAKIMPVQVLGANGGTADQVAAGIRYAADRGADIINMSLGSVFGSNAVKSAVDYAVGQGVLVIAASGNCGNNSYLYNGCFFRNQPAYPAAYPNVVAVAATTSANGHASYSTQGTQVEVAAPGDNIYSTIPGGRYTYSSGTSMASPHVAGVAALIWSYYPNLSANDVRVAMRSTATDLGTGGFDVFFGYGMVNTTAALNAVRDDLFRTAEAPDAAEFVAAPVDPFGVPADQYAAGQLLVQLDGAAGAADTLARVRASEQFVMQAAAAHGLTILAVESLDELGVLRLHVPDGQEAATVAALSATDGVAYAELNIIYRSQ